ncbi:MAG: 1-acyl-sn-glycerol-3-phosphate acyltransferase, partial [Holophagales bacterium]|nr:1-acyl-sn-glycerol-3-phosphate acyltransferase [Holophagales bacterium]
MPASKIPAGSGRSRPAAGPGETGPLPPPAIEAASRTAVSQGLWRRFCSWVTDVFYRRNEVSGAEQVPASGPVILAANHVNALVDALVVQSAIGRPVHPIARSGLFRNPLLRPVLRFIQAVPIQRRPAPNGAGEQTEPLTPEQVRAANEAAFGTLYRYLEEGRVILIFPEGQSHSDPSLRPLKTGAARLALGHLRRTGQAPLVLPVGLTFTQKGRFRSDVLVQVGEGVPFRPVHGEEEETAVR